MKQFWSCLYPSIMQTCQVQWRSWTCLSYNVSEHLRPKWGWQSNLTFIPQLLWHKHSSRPEKGTRFCHEKSPSNAIFVPSLALVDSRSSSKSLNYSVEVFVFVLTFNFYKKIKNYDLRLNKGWAFQHQSECNGNFRVLRHSSIPKWPNGCA